MLNHKNVVILYAMVFESQHYGVVLEFVPNGCLDDFIFQNKVLFNMLYLSEKRGLCAILFDTASSQKMLSHKFCVTTASRVDRFLEFFHRHTQQ